MKTEGMIKLALKETEEARKRVQWRHIDLELANIEGLLKWVLED